MAFTSLTQSNDTFTAGNSDDIVQGLGGDDRIDGGNGADLLDGGTGDDRLDGGKGDDTLVGGEGDDRLTGGNGADTFNYNFTVTESRPESFTDWLVQQGGGEAVIDGELADGTTQDFFATRYTAWLNWLVDTYALGKDLDGDGRISVELNQNAPSGTPWIEGMSAEELATLFADRQNVILKTGNTSQERFYSDSFSADQTLVSSLDGHDTIADFKLGTDKLNFSGLGALGITAANFGDHFALAVLDADHDGVADDSRLTLAGSDDWSLTLLNVNTDLAGLYGSIEFA